MDLAAVATALAAMGDVAAGAGGGPLAALPPSERFHWLAAPSSTIIQPSATHTGLSDDPQATLERLFRALVTGCAGESPAGEALAGEGPAGAGPAGEAPAGAGPAGEGPAGEGPAAGAEPGAGLEARARAWHHARHAAVCDASTPWAHGTVVRAGRYPSYYDFNLVRVERDPQPMGVPELIAFADEALAGLAHRRIELEVLAAGDRLRAGFEAQGWQAMRLLWMRRGREALPPPSAPGSFPVQEVPYDAAHDLRAVWNGADHAEMEASGHYAVAREVAQRRRVRVLAVCEGGVPVAFAQLERAGDGVEITEVFVHPERRGAGVGTAVTCAAIESAGDVRDLWICADDEDRPKHLYARLGFQPVWTTMEVQRLP